MAHSKSKATREREEIKCATSLHVFLQKKYGVKAKCKDEDAEYTSFIEINVEEEFPAEINVVKEIEGDNDNEPKQESFSACGKERY